MEEFAGPFSPAYFRGVVGESGLLEKAEASEMRGAQSRKDYDSDLPWASKREGMGTGSCRAPVLPWPCSGPQIKNSVSTSLSPPQPWTPTKDKVRMGYAWAPGLPRSPTFLQPSSKAWGPQGGSLQEGSQHQVHQLMPLVQWTRIAWGEGHTRKPVLSGKHSSPRVLIELLPQPLYPHPDDNPIKERCSNPTSPIFQMEKLRHKALK